MRSALLLAVVVLAAGCVDPAATVDDQVDRGAPPPNPIEAIVVEPVFDLLDLDGTTTRQIMLGSLAILNASATPTENLTSLRYLWLEQEDMLRGGTLWPPEPFEAQTLEPTIIMPGSEGTHRLTVVAESETGHMEERVLHIGVSVEEEWSWDLDAASPLEPPEPCHPGWSLLGEPATVQERFLVVPVPLEREVARFSVRPGPGVEVAWCRGNEVAEAWEENGWLHTLPGSAQWEEIELWVANVDAQEVVVDVERFYPGDPRH